MKKIFILPLFLCIISFSVKAQEIDQRVVKNKGDQASQAFRNNRNSYNFYLFELDSAYQVKLLKNLTKEEQKLVQNNINWTLEEWTKLGTSDFNYWNLGLRIQPTERQYIQIDENRVFVLLAMREVTALFTQSPLNTK